MNRQVFLVSMMLIFPITGMGLICCIHQAWRCERAFRVGKELNVCGIGQSANLPIYFRSFNDIKNTSYFVYEIGK